MYFISMSLISGRECTREKNYGSQIFAYQKQRVYQLKMDRHLTGINFTVAFFVFFIQRGFVLHSFCKHDKYVDDEIIDPGATFTYSNDQIQTFGTRRFWAQQTAPLRSIFYLQYAQKSGLSRKTAKNGTNETLFRSQEQFHTFAIFGSVIVTRSSERSLGFPHFVFSVKFSNFANQQISILRSFYYLTFALSYFMFNFHLNFFICSNCSYHY